MEFNKAKLEALMADRKKMMGTKGPGNFKPGKNRVRIGPGWDPAARERWWHEWGKHYVKDAQGNMLEGYVCDYATYGKSCPVCAALKAALRASPDDATTKVLSESAAQRKTLINVQFLDSPTPATWVTVAIGSRLYSQIETFINDHGIEVVLDPKAGHEIIVTRTGEGMKTEYSATIAMKPGTPIPDEVIKALPNLAEFVDSNPSDQSMKAIGAIGTIAALPAPAGVTTGGARPATTATALGLSTGDVAPIGAVKNAPTGAETVEASIEDVALDAELDDLLK